MTVAKECVMCKKIFSPKSMKAAEWQDRCQNCYADKKESRNAVRANSKTQASILAMEKRILAMEEKFSNIELVIEMATKGVMDETFDKIRDETVQEVKGLVDKHIQRSVEKWQLHMVAMNNRLLNITKELGLDD